MKHTPYIQKNAEAISGSEPFDGVDFTNFWNDCDYAKKEYIEPAPSDELIAEIEAEPGYKLPASYIWLMKQHNGGLPVNTRFPTDTPTSWAEDHSTYRSGKRLCYYAAGR